MIEAFNKHINSNLPFLKNGKSILAISGGIDSVVLTYLCKHFDLDFALAHCNFNLRGAESDADEQFVIALAEKLDVEVFIQSFDTVTYSKKYKLSTQMAARELRYNWFREIILQLGFEYILTAHHADDNLETFLINLSRGTGLDGLVGIPEVNDNIIRPLLPFSREVIEKFAKEESISWKEDSSNASNKYQRNKLRLEIIPKLKELNPELLQNFSKTISHLKESQQIIEDSIYEVADKVIKVADSGIYLNVEQIQSLNNPKAYLYELLKEYGFTEWNDVVALLEAQAGKQLFSEKWRLVKDRDFLILSELRPEEGFKTISISKDENKVSVSNKTLLFEAVNEVGKSNANTIFLDVDKLYYPLVIRKKKEGDYFYPLGMKGKKKLSKYFKDEKLSLIDKENTLLLCSNNDIVWVIGRRADDRYKVTPATKNILKISIT